MRRFSAFIGILGIVTCLNQSINGANWYLDNAAQNSANNGTSWENAWTNFTSVRFKSDHFTGVTGGDTLYISGGNGSKVYPAGTNWYCLSIGSGTSTNQMVTVAPGKDPGHDGLVIFDGLGLQSLECFFWVGAAQYIKVDGRVNGEKHFLFRNIYRLTARDAGHAINGAPRHSIFDSIIVTNCGNGFRFVSADNIEISNCEMRAIRGDHCIMAFGGGESFDRFRIHHNYLQGNTSVEASLYGGGPDGVQIGAGGSIYNNEFVTLPLGNLLPDVDTVGPAARTMWQHPDSVQGGQNFLKVYNNFFNSSLNASYSGDPEGPVIRDYYFFNNVFAYNEPKYIISSLFGSGYVNPITTISNIYWINNTIIDFAVPWGVEWDKTKTSKPLVKNIVFHNNIFVNSPGIYAPVEFGTYLNPNFSLESVIASHNLIYPPVANMFHTGASSLGGYYFDQQSALKGFPIFAKYSKYSKSNDLRLSVTDTAALNTGLNLTALASSNPGVRELAFDIAGVPRPSTGPWSAGAYNTPVAFSIPSQSAPPAPPINLRLSK